MHLVTSSFFLLVVNFNGLEPASGPAVYCAPEVGPTGGHETFSTFRLQVLFDQRLLFSTWLWYIF